MSRGKVRTSIPMETYSTCDFRGGERVCSLTDFTRGGGGCSITCRGVVSVQYSYGRGLLSESTNDMYPCNDVAYLLIHRFRQIILMIS